MAKVAQPGIPNRFAEHVEVTGGAGCPYEIQEPPAPSLAVGCKGPVGGDELGLLRGRAGDRVIAALRGAGARGNAPHRVALANPAGIPLHDVEPVDELRREHRASSSGRSSSPEAPGPPGLMNSEPMRSAGREAGWRATARWIQGPARSA